MKATAIYIAVAQLIGFLPIAITAIRNPSSSFGSPLHRMITVSPINEQETPTAKSLRTLIQIRGGDIHLADEGEGGYILSKFRNIVRSVLSISDRKAKPLSSILRGCLKGIESIIGIKILPVDKKQKMKKKVAKKSDGKKTSKDVEKPSKVKSSASTKKHLSTKIKSTNPNYRVQRELKEFMKSPPPNLSVKVGSNMRVWIVTMIGAKNSIYEGEVFKLRVSFPPQYPTVPPSVYFLQGHIPTHEHVYTNGDICLSLLGKDWRPTMTAQSIAVSILSILSSAQSKSLPMDNARHAGNKPGEYQEGWVYHDDNC